MAIEIVGLRRLSPTYRAYGTPEYNSLVQSGQRWLDDRGKDLNDLGATIGGLIYDWTHDDPMQGPMMAAPGNQADTQIRLDYGEDASAAKLCGGEPPNRCDWLDKNESKYRPDQVQKTRKAWGCKGSRWSKGGKNR